MRRRRAHSGFTLIEILVVLAIVGILAGLSIRGLRSLARSDLRASVSHLSGAIRYLFDRASTTGQYHRLVIDIETGRYWAEVSDDMFYLPRGCNPFGGLLSCIRDQLAYARFHLGDGRATSGERIMSEQSLRAM